MVTIQKETQVNRKRSRRTVRGNYRGSQGAGLEARRAAKKEQQSPNPLLPKTHPGAALGTVKAEEAAEEVAEGSAEGVEEEEDKRTSLVKSQK